jgi:hypothetical protein
MAGNREVKLRLPGAAKDVVSLVTILQMLPEASRGIDPRDMLAQLGITVTGATDSCNLRRNQAHGIATWDMVLQVTDAPAKTSQEG